MINRYSLYYAATGLFLLLDYVWGVNIRVAFLDDFPLARIGYYGVLVVCLILILLRPAWSVLVTTFESLITLLALIFGMAMRTLVPTDAMLESGGGFVSTEELINFLLVGSMAYYSWTMGVKSLSS